MIAAPRTWRQVAGRVRRQFEVGAGHRWLELDVPADFATPEPGQFVQLLLPPTASRTLLPRPMSIASARRRSDHLTLGFLYAAVGAGTHALAAQRAGAAVEVLGPLGHGFPLDADGAPVLVAGGRGVAPLLFAARALARRGRRAALLFGARDRDHLVALDEARRALRRLHGELHLATDDGSAGHPGHVAALLAKLAPRLDRDGRGIVVHACGPHGMLRAVAQWGMARGVACHLAMESVMACGTGICRGCPLPRAAAARAAFDPATPSLFGNREWAMCCTEGPVFPAAALDWQRIE